MLIEKIIKMNTLPGRLSQRKSYNIVSRNVCFNLTQITVRD